MCPAVVVTTSEGLNCVVTFILECTGIKYPLSLDIDMRGQLWVGCGTGGEQSGATIHKVKLL
jgi:hypothetical protein